MNFQLKLPNHLFRSSGPGPTTISRFPSTIWHCLRALGSGLHVFAHVLALKMNLVSRRTIGGGMNLMGSTYLRECRLPLCKLPTQRATPRPQKNKKKSTNAECKTQSLSSDRLRMKPILRVVSLCLKVIGQIGSNIASESKSSITLKFLSLYLISSIKDSKLNVSLSELSNVIYKEIKRSQIA